MGKSTRQLVASSAALPGLLPVTQSLFLACLTQLIPEGFIHSQLEKGLMAPITLTMFAG